MYGLKSAYFCNMEKSLILFSEKTPYRKSLATMRGPKRRKGLRAFRGFGNKNLLICYVIVVMALFFHSFARATGAPKGDPVVSPPMTSTHDGEICARVLSEVSGQILPQSQMGVWRGERAAGLMPLRANALDFWQAYTKMVEELLRWAAETLGADGNEDLRNLFAKGFVVGDPHNGNFSDAVINGDLRVVLVDFDDSGWGEWLFDIFKHLMISTIAMGKVPGENPGDEIQLINSYLRGLHGKEQEPPAFVKKALKTSGGDIEESRKNSVHKLIEGERLIRSGKKNLINQGDLDIGHQTVVGQDLDQLRGYMENHFGKVVDVAYRVKDHGGSQGQLRFWFLVKEKSQGKKKKSRLRIFEVKALELPAANGEGVQGLTAFDRYLRLVQLFWGVEEFPENFRVLEGPSGTEYWMRERSEAELDMGDEPQGRSEKEDYWAFSEYLAYLMGEAHGRQEGSRAYAEVLKRHMPLVLTFMDRAANNYINSIK